MVVVVNKVDKVNEVNEVYKVDDVDVGDEVNELGEVDEDHRIENGCVVGEVNEHLEVKGVDGLARSTWATRSPSSTMTTCDVNEADEVGEADKCK